MTFQKILFPVAFSERCRGAAPYVRAFANRLNAQVELLHVLEAQFAVIGAPELAVLPDEDATEEMVRTASNKLLDFRGELMHDVQAKVCVKTGEAASLIIATAREQLPDMIMMPTHGYGPFRRFILGSVTAKVLHDVDCPIWTSAHMEEPPSPNATTISRVLCALDVQDRSPCTLRYAVELAKAWGAELEIVHTITAPEAQPGKHLDSEFRTFLYETAKQKIAEYQTLAGVNVPVHINGGDIVRHVRDVASQRYADILIIGRSTHTLLGALRTHAYALIRESPCPVLSI